MFVSRPFIKCPKCGQKTFGVLLIFDDHYLRRCKECDYPHPSKDEPSASYSLPPLDKKIIYIDQFTISNMMKALNPATKAYQKGKVDKYWVKLFERLDSLCKLQLIICPDSSFHIDESLLSPFYKSLKRMYELLSHGLTFCDSESIKRYQVYEHASNWVSGHPDKELDLNVQKIVYGKKINVWQDRFIFSGNIHYPEDWIEEIRNSRERVCERFDKVFKRWQSETERSFYDWFEEIAMFFGIATLQEYLNCIEKAAKFNAGLIALTINDVIESLSVEVVNDISDAFNKAGIQNLDIPDKTIQYLTSNYIKDIPFNKILSMLYAGLARKAAAGKKKPPNVGMDYDIKIISTLLPYCDAMLIDNECHAYLKEKPLCDKIDYGTAIFSYNSKEVFMEYLDQIEKSASKEHMDKVCEVYGEDWHKPYVSLYK